MRAAVTNQVSARGRGREQLFAQMDALTAKYLICELWLLIDVARDRDLSMDEASEVHRLCEAISHGVYGKDEFSARAEGLPLFVFSSGVCEKQSEPSVRKVLAELTALQNLL